MNDQQPPQPSLTLLPGDAIGLAELLDLYRHLTGREPTPEEVEEARRELEEGKAGGQERG
jgi:hypothetical protein